MSHFTKMAQNAVSSPNFTCRCHVSCSFLRSRPRGSGQYVLCSIDENLFAVCRIALATGDSSTPNQPPQVDASVTLRRKSQSFRALESSLLADTNKPSPSNSFRGYEVLWVPRRAVRIAASVTLELLPSSVSMIQSQLLRDADTRSLLQQTLQRNVVVCTDAIVNLPTLDGLVAKSKGVVDDEEKLVMMTFRVVSTYPAGGLTRVTSGTRVTLTDSTGNRPTNEVHDGAQAMNLARTIPASSQPNSQVKIGGMEKERTALRELILLPFLHPRMRSDLGVELPKSILLCGPPGVGKTLLVRSVVYECRQATNAAGATLDLHMQVINGSEILTSGQGDAEQALRETFETAVAHSRSLHDAASVIFIDELDALCPKRETHGAIGSSVHGRIVAQLLTLLDGVDGSYSRENVVVVGATNLPNAIDPALRRPGRFDREIFVSPPTTALRKEIFKVHLDQTPYALVSEASEKAEDQRRDVFLDTLAAKSVGYVGADIAALCREAAMIASTRQLVALSQDRDLKKWWDEWQRRVEPLSALKHSSTTLEVVIAGRAWHANPIAIIPLWFLAKKSNNCRVQKNAETYFRFILGKKKKHFFFETKDDTMVNEEEQPPFQVTMQDFEQAMESVTPSLLRSANGFMKDFQRQDWDSIGGQAATKLALQQALEWPLRFPQTFARLGVQPPRGILLYGPPGCSKSSIVRVAAHATGATFLSLSAAQVFSPFFGDAEAAVRQIFRDARAALPAIIFFDEIDVMVAKREFSGADAGEGGTSTAMRVLSTMLNEMDGVESADGLLVIGATNRPTCIDAALMRPGRFDRILFVDLPAEPDRVDILRIHTRSMQLHVDVNLEDVAKRTPYFSGAELENLCREAALLALRESLDADRVCMRHFDHALDGISPLSSKESIREYVEFADAMGHLS